MNSERHHRQEIVRIGRMIHERGYVAATDGNLSVRLRDGHILVTPTGMSKGLMKVSDLVVVDAAGTKLRGKRGVSSEIAMHLLIYRLRQDVHAVVHAHPPTATGYAAAGQALNPALLSEVVIALEDIPLAAYGTPGTSELCDTLAPLVPRYQAILMSNHGVVTYGTDLLTAYMHMETVEHFAKVALVAHMLGRQHLLSEEDMRKLATAREKYMGSPKNGSRAPAAKTANGREAASAGRKRGLKPNLV
jgi:L-fuculose-phosphate aldolase